MKLAKAVWFALVLLSALASLGLADDSGTVYPHLIVATVKSQGVTIARAYCVAPNSRSPLVVPCARPLVVTWSLSYCEGDMCSGGQVPFHVWAQDNTVVAFHTPKSKGFYVLTAIAPESVSATTYYRRRVTEKE